MQSYDGAAHGDIVIAKIGSSKNCRRRPDLDTAVSLAFEKKFGLPAITQIFFIPKPLAGEYYTLRQISEIEQSLIPMSIDLLPLDYNLVH